MNVDEKLIKRVAELARLNLTEEEVLRFLPQLREILEAFSQLDTADVSGVAPSFQPIELRDALREDAIEPSLPQDIALSNSKHVKDGYFKGPKAV